MERSRARRSSQAILSSRRLQWKPFVPGVSVPRRSTVNQWKGPSGSTSTFTGPGSLSPQQFQIARDRLNSAIEIRKVEFFVRRVQVVVGQAETHQHARNT